MLDIFVEIENERERQDALKASGKFVWTCADNYWSINGFVSFISPDRKNTVLCEEVGEVSKEVTDYGISQDKYHADGLNFPSHRHIYYLTNIRTELIQIAAVCVAWIQACDKLIAEYKDK